MHPSVCPGKGRASRGLYRLENHYMGTVTFEHLDEIPARHLERLATLLAEDGQAAPPRLAAIYTVLAEVLRAEQQRRAQWDLPHSAPAVAVALPTTGELSDTEMQGIMRQMLDRRTAIAGGTSVECFFDTVLTALQATRTDQRHTLRRMHEDLQ